MKIVKISDLSEEERKKALEEQEQRYQENEANRKAELKRVADLNTELRIQEKMDKVYNSAPIAENGYTSNKQGNKNIWNDLKGVASNFTRSLGNLGINAYENVNRINGEYINQRNKLLEDTNNKYLTKSLESKGYTEQQSQKIMNNTPTLESIANNSKVLNSITNNANKIIQPMEKNFQEWENANNQKIQENIENASNPLSKKILELTPSIAQSSVNLIPGGNVLFSAGITQNYYEDAKQQKGMSDEEASRYAAIMATLESATEMIGAGLTKNVGKALIKGNVKSALVNYGLDIGENFLEEAVMEPLNELTTTAVAGKEKANWENIGQRSLQAGIDGAITSVLMGGASAGVGSAVNVVNKISNGQTVAQSEIQTAVKDTQNSGIVDVESILKDEMNNAINKSNLQQNQTNNSNILPTAQTIQEQNKMSQNQTSEQTNNIPIDKYNISAKKYNIDIKNETVQSIKKVTEQRGINTTYNAEMFKDSTTNAIWKTTTDTNGNTIREVILNPKADTNKTLQNVIVHELTHDFEGTKEYTQLADTIMKNVTTKTDYETARKALEDTYSKVYDKNSVEFKSLVDQEAVADVLGNKLGNQEFVSNLTMEQPSVAKRIYNWVIDKLNKITGYSNERIFWTDVKNKFENAYRQDYKENNNNSKYSIQTDNNGNKYVKVDTDQDIFNGIAEKDYNKIAKMYMQDYLKGKTNLSENDSVSVGNKGISKYTNPKQTTRYMTEKMKLSTELKNALEIAQKDSISAPTKDTSKYPKWEYYKFNFELGGKNFEGTINIGIDKDGNKHFYEINKIHTTSNSHVSASKSSSTDSINNSIAPIKNDVNTTAKYSMQESENNSGSFSFDKNVKRYEDLEIANIVKFNKKSDGTINIEISDNSKLINQFTVYSKENASKQLGNNIANYIYDNATENSKIINLKQVENVEVQDRTNKQKQLEIIKKTNPMMDGYHIGIRSIDDIKTFDEVIDNEVESFAWGDFTKKDAENALKKGKITIYSSYPIKQGTFVSTSKIQAEEYAGGIGKKVYSKTVSLEEVAWINGDEGQYANTNQRYSQNNENWQKFLNQNYKSEGTGQTIKDVKLPTAQKQVAPTAKNNVLSTGEYTKQNGINQNNIETNSDLPISENQKFRKHYKSIIQSQYTTDEAKAISKELMKTDTYVPESNNKQLERADKRIELSGADSELSSLMSRSMTGGNIKADDIAVGERLIQYYSKTGNKAKLQEAIQATAMAGTTAGQTVQAMSLLNHQTPEGQAIWLQRSVDKMNNDLVKIRGEKADQFTLTPEMTEKIVNSKNTEELQKNLNEVYEELGQQVAKTNLQKIDAWRYFSMLANPRTHIRNIVGNTAMSGMQYGIKNKIAGSIESVVSKINPEMERTHTIVPASKEVKQFAKNDIKNVADRLGLNENKYNPKTRLENSMRTFKSDAMENTFGKLFELNDKALEAEDGWGLKAGYTKALSEYMTANKLTPENITDKQLAKARNYAIEQAQEATFHQTSALSTLLNQFSNKNKVTKFIMDSTLPFKKTPINVAKSGLEYSPIGLAKSAIYDTIELRKGNISINKYIDNISKGLTGTGIALVGYALANAGILKASGSDDKDKESFDQDRGSQTYSIQIGDNTYSLDWLAPSGIPLFIGAECFEIMQTDKETKTSSSDEDSSYNQAIKSATDILDAFTNAMNPMTEMSMLSGLTSALKSYDGDNSKMLANLGVNAVKSYVNQFVPTALGQVAKTTDEYERSTTSTKTGTLPKAIDSTKNYAMSKIPGLRQMLPTKTDIWGNELKQSNNVLQRGLENSVFPWTRKGLTTTDVDKELNNVYKNTGESSVLPDNINKKMTINKQDYIMTSEEYAKYKKLYRQSSYNLLNNLVYSTEYKKLNDSQKQLAIEKAYEYSKEQIKIDYAKNNDLEYEESKLSKTINLLKKSNTNTSNYLEYLALTKDMDKDIEKLETLSNSKFTDKTKQLIYENNLLNKSDKKYGIIKNTGLNINSYLKYKLADSNKAFSADKKDDGTEDGKSIIGSGNVKRFNYINSIQGASYTQKLILYALDCKPSNKYQKELVVNYIKSNYKGEKQKEVLKLFGVTFYKDGTYKY